VNAEPDPSDVLAVFPEPAELAKVLAAGQALADSYPGQSLLIAHRASRDVELIIYRLRS
jgi:hypothetical protein